MKAKPPETKKASQPPAEIGLKGEARKAGFAREKCPAATSFEGQKELDVALLKHSREKNWDVVEALLRRGAKPSEKDLLFYNAGTYAAEEGKTLILAMMVRRGLCFSINEGASRAAYIKAIAGGHTQTVKFILRNSDFIDGMEKREFTPREKERLLEFIRENLVD